MQPSKPYGKIRPEDFTLLKKSIAIFKSRGLYCGIHGTSLWNPRYKDIDLLVVQGDSTHRAPAFLSAIEDLKFRLGGEIIQQKGDASIGYDVEVKAGSCVLHISYVLLL